MSALALGPSRPGSRTSRPPLFSGRRAMSTNWGWSQTTGERALGNRGLRGRVCRRRKDNPSINWSFTKTRS